MPLNPTAEDSLPSAENAAILPYEPQCGAKVLQLVSDERTIRIVFPATSRWALWASVVGSLLNAGAAFALVSFWLWLVFVDLTPPSPQPISTYAGFILKMVPELLGGLFWLALGLLELRRHLRWGGFRRQLEADSTELRYTRVGLFGVRCRTWKANQIKAIDVKTTKGIFGTGSVSFLVIRFYGQWSRTFRIATPRPELVEQIVTALRSTLLANRGKSTSGALTATP